MTGSISYRINAFRVLAISFLAIALSACQDDRPDAAQSILAAFQASCASHGQWSDAAVRSAQSIQGILKSLQDNDACKSIRSQIQWLSSFQGSLTQSLSSASYRSVRTLELQLEEETLAMSQATDSSLKAALQSAVVDTQVNLAFAKANRTTIWESSSIDDAITGSQLVSDLARGILSNSAGFSQCLKQSPAAAVQLASNLVGLGGSFVSPVYGVGASALGQLIQIGVEGLRQAPITDATYKLNQAMMPGAITCGLESLTELYCNAQDTSHLLALAPANPLQQQELVKIDEKWRGVDLVGRRIRVLNDWLLKLRNGSDPSDMIDAERQNLAWSSLFQFETAPRRVRAFIRENKAVIDKLPDDNQKKDAGFALANSILQFIGPYPNVSNSSPYTNISTDIGMFACMLVFGVQDAQAKPCSPYSNTQGIEAYIRDISKGALLTPEVLLQHFDEIHVKSEKLALASFNRVIAPDPQSILAASDQRTFNNLSPKEVLISLSRFLADLRVRAKRPDLVRLVDQTATKVNEALKQLDPALACATDDGFACSFEEDRRRIDRLFELFELKRGLLFFNERVTNLVEWDLVLRLEAGEFDDATSAILSLSAANLQDRLMSSGVVLGRDVLEQDLAGARALTRQVISVFNDFFEKAAIDAVESLDSLSQFEREPARGVRDRSFGQTLGQLCALLTVTRPEIRGTELWKTCSRATYSSLNGTESNPFEIRIVDLEKDLRDKPSAERLCAYHRFMRESRVRELAFKRARNTSAIGLVRALSFTAD